MESLNIEQLQRVAAALAAFEERGGWDALELYLSAEPQTIDATCNDDEGEIQTLESGAAQLLREVRMLRAEVAK